MQSYDQLFSVRCSVVQTPPYPQPLQVSASPWTTEASTRERYIIRGIKLTAKQPATIEIRAGLKGWGARGNFSLEGPYDVIHDVIVWKSYVFAYSQGSRLFFPVVENVLTRQMHIQLAARR